jgi:hypothetical protein
MSLNTKQNIVILMADQRAGWTDQARAIDRQRGKAYAHLSS